MIAVIILSLAILNGIIWLWVDKIDYMHKHHNDYKGEDFLNWDIEKNSAGRDGWDDNLIHTENEI